MKKNILLISVCVLAFLFISFTDKSNKSNRYFSCVKSENVKLKNIALSIVSCQGVKNENN